MSVIKTPDLLRRLERSRLLDREQAEKADHLLGSESDAEAAARLLVNANLITRWQARQLLAIENPKFFIGQYKLLKEIGRGSMGVVYRACHLTMSRLVAIKVLPKEFAQDERSIARFQREIRTVAVLDHPHIARALDAGRDKNLHYLVMEYVDGKDLKVWIKSQGRLPIPWSCACIRQAAAGLQHAFERGVTHRDIKPSNLIVLGDPKSENPHIKLVDFGLARVSDELAGDLKLTRVGRTVGTWDYMAPEQTQNSSWADTRSDLFGLGCTLFQMLTGELPFRGRSDVESLTLRNTRDAPRLSSLIPQVDPRLDEITAKLLARQPADRYQTPAELIAALDSLPLLQTGIPHGPVPHLPPPAEVDTDASLDSTNPEFNQFLATSPSLSSGHASSKPADHAQQQWEIRFWQNAFRVGMLAILIGLLFLFWIMW